MDTKIFLKEIRSIIREEIEYALEKKLQKDKKELDVDTLKHGLRLFKESQAKEAKLKNLVQPKPTQPQRSTQNVKGTKNNFIHDILEQTRQSLQESADFDNEFRFTSNSVIPTSTHGAIPDGVDPDTIAPEVASALTRDYSALMAKINEKKGS